MSEPEKQIWFVTAEWVQLPSAIVSGNGSGQPPRPTLERKCGIINEHPAVHYVKQFAINPSYIINFACPIDRVSAAKLRSMGINWEEEQPSGK
jgi:hypothetical protein